jgi:LysR family transcriptional regulator, transcriptional activator for dmlA
VWRLTDLNGSEKVEVTGRLSANNAEILRGWGKGGHGILLQARWDVSGDLRAGRRFQTRAARWRAWVSSFCRSATRVSSSGPQLRPSKLAINSLRGSRRRLGTVVPM